jgi:hypothetical protein
VGVQGLLGHLLIYRIAVANGVSYIHGIPRDPIEFKANQEEKRK